MTVTAPIQRNGAAEGQLHAARPYFLEPQPVYPVTSLRHYQSTTDCTIAGGFNHVTIKDVVWVI